MTRQSVVRTIQIEMVEEYCIIHIETDSDGEARLLCEQLRDHLAAGEPITIYGGKPAAYN